MNHAFTDPSYQNIPGKKLRLSLFGWLQALVFSLTFIILLLSFFSRSVTVSGSSMVPTLHDSDHLFLHSLSYQIEQGDIVVIHNAFGSSLDYQNSIIKRVIAVGGQQVHIDYDENLVYVDGIPLDELYINEEMVEPHSTSFNTITDATVPQGYIFVMGDNRNNSSDSRDERISLVDTRNVLGRAFLRVTPITEFKIFS